MPLKKPFIILMVLFSPIRWEVFVVVFFLFISFLSFLPFSSFNIRMTQIIVKLVLLIIPLFHFSFFVNLAKQ